MPNSIEITRDFPPTRERAVLLELLRIMRILRNEGIDALICGGWVPFLKELARHCHTAHTMSLDIDLLLRAAARERENIDRLKMLLLNSLEFERSNEASFRYEKSVDGNLVQLELLADIPRRREDEAIVKFYGSQTALDLCLIDGGENLNEHVETIQINCREGEKVDNFEVVVPDAAGFLLLKTTVCNYRRKPKDPYDIYYYCRYSEDPEVIHQKLADSISEPAIATTIAQLRSMFRYEDSQWIEMILDYMLVSGDDRDREAQYILRSVHKVTEGL